MFVEQPNTNTLFAQLRLDGSDEGVTAFIEQHKGLNKSQYIENAPFWSEGQATFLRNAVLDYAGWAQVIDPLNVALH